MNENGELFADLSLDNDLVIGGSVFLHKVVHKATLRSPDYQTENRIEYVCIGRAYRTSLLDIRLKIGADAASDHHLLTARM